MSHAVPFEFGPLSLAVLGSARGRTELSVSAFEQPLGRLVTTLAPELDTLLGAETESAALYKIFSEHCVPLLRSRAQRGPASLDALCLRLVHPCDNPQCDTIHELLCMNSASSLLAHAAPVPPGSGTPFTLVDEAGQPLAATQYLGEADTERLLSEYVAPPLVDMASYFSPACMETDLARWEPPTDADQDIISYFGFFSGSSDALYGVYQYLNPLLLGIWMDRISACIHSPGQAARAAAQQAWFKLLGRLLVLPPSYLDNAIAAPARRLPTLAPAGGGSHRLH